MTAARKPRDPIAPIPADGQPVKYTGPDAVLCSGHVWARALPPKSVPLAGVHLWVRAADGWVLITRGPGGSAPWHAVVPPPEWDLDALGVRLATVHSPTSVTRAVTIP